MTEPTLLRKHKLRARKVHRCWHCGKAVPAGTLYSVHKMALDGEAYTLKMHSDCEHAAQFFMEHIGAPIDWMDGAPPLSEMLEDAEDCNRLRGYFPHAVTRVERWRKP